MGQFGRNHLVFTLILIGTYISQSYKSTFHFIELNLDLIKFFFNLYKVFDVKLDIDRYFTSHDLDIKFHMVGESYSNNIGFCISSAGTHCRLYGSCLPEYMIYVVLTKYT